MVITPLFLKKVIVVATRMRDIVANIAGGAKRKVVNLFCRWRMLFTTKLHAGHSEQKDNLHYSLVQLIIINFFHLLLISILLPVDHKFSYCLSLLSLCTLSLCQCIITINLIT